MSIEPQKDAVDIVEETQEFERKKSSEDISVGDKVVHSRLYLGICRGIHRVKAASAVYEVIGVTERSITTRPWGSAQPYGSQFEKRYIKRADKID